MRRVALSGFLLLVLLVIAACSDGKRGIQITVAPTRIGAGAPVYTPTPVFSPTRTPSPTLTLTVTPSLTLTPTLTETPSPTFTPLFSPTPTGTQPLIPPTIAGNSGAPASITIQWPGTTAASGWSCEEFPCEDDINGFMQRIQVPAGFSLSHVGRFPGQPMQITYGPDGLLYATILENGTRTGAVYVMREDGSSTRYSDTLISPIGLAFQPGTQTLYVSARLRPDHGGGLWRVDPDGTTEAVIKTLPCCYNIIDNQPNGIEFGPDGYLYMGLGSLSDRGEPDDPTHYQYATLDPLEATILRIQPHTGDMTVFAKGIRNPYDITFDSTGQMYATDDGLVSGPGDRVLQVQQDAHYGWPYYRNYGWCTDCPQVAPQSVSPALVGFPNYTLPRGIVAYTGAQFPANLYNAVFVALWNGTENGQQIALIDPRDPRVQYQSFVPEAFVTGLIRPVDVVVAPDGSLVIADFIYGHIWRVSYTGG